MPSATEVVSSKGRFRNVKMPGGLREPWTWDDFPDLMNSRHCMEILDVSENTLYELSKSGFLRDVVVHVGRQLRYPKASLRRALEGPRADR